MKIALRIMSVVLVTERPECAYQNDGIVSVRVGKHLLGALYTIQYCIDLNVYLAEEFKQDLQRPLVMFELTLKLFCVPSD